MSGVEKKKKRNVQRKPLPRELRCSLCSGAACAHGPRARASLLRIPCPNAGGGDTREAGRLRDARSIKYARVNDHYLVAAAGKLGGESGRAGVVSFSIPSRELCFGF